MGLWYRVQGRRIILHLACLGLWHGLLGQWVCFVVPLGPRQPGWCVLNVLIDLGLKPWWQCPVQPAVRAAKPRLVPPLLCSDRFCLYVAWEAVGGCQTLEEGSDRVANSSSPRQHGA